MQFANYWPANNGLPVLCCGAAALFLILFIL